MKRILTLIFALSILSTTIGQTSKLLNFKRFSVDLYGGAPIFYGDIQNQILGAYTVTGRFNWHMTSVFSLGAEFSFGEVRGLDNNTQAEYFNTKYMKAMFGTELYAFNLLKFNELSDWFQPFAGISVGAIKPNVENSGSLNTVNPIHFNDWVLAHQWDVGTKFKITDWLDINARYSLIFMQTDKFDNLDKTSPTNKYNDALTNIELGFAIHFGGGPKESIIWKQSSNEFADIKSQDSLKTNITSLEQKAFENKKNLNSINKELKEVKQTNKSLNSQLKVLMALIKKDKETTTNISSNVGSSNITSVGNKNYPIKENDIIIADDSFYKTTLTGPTKAKYYLISGSYDIDRNAQTRKNELTNRGYSPFIMVEPSVNRKRVVIDSSNDYNETIFLLNKYKNEVDKTIWVIKNANY